MTFKNNLKNSYFPEFDDLQIHMAIGFIYDGHPMIKKIIVKDTLLLQSLGVWIYTL